MIEISPKIVASNFISYLFKNLKNSKNTKPMSWVKWYLGAVALSFGTMFMSPRQDIIVMSYSLRFFWSLVIPFGFVFVGLLFIIPIFGFTIWPKRWIYGEDHVQIVHGKSSTNIPYSSFIKIVLDRPYSAGLYFKNSSGFPAIVTTNWYGTSKEDWLAFISFLRTKVDNLDMKIGVVTGAGPQDPGTLCTAEEAYERINAL